MRQLFLLTGVKNIGKRQVLGKMGINPGANMVAALKELDDIRVVKPERCPQNWQES